MTEKTEVSYKGTIAVCTPMWGDLAYRSYINTVLLLSDALRQKGYSMAFYTIGDETLTTKAKNILVHQALQTEDLVGILFIDADIDVNPDDIMSLIESNKDFIGAVTPKKLVNWAQVKNAVLMKEEDLSLYSGQYSINFLNNDAIQVNYDQPLEVKHLGSGLLYVSASVFEKLKNISKSYKNPEADEKSNEDFIFEFFSTSIEDETKEFLADDYYFCEKWRSINGTVWAAPWVQVVRSGSYNFRGSFAHTVDMISRLNELSNIIKTD